MKTLPRSSSGCSISYHASGEGKPLVFLHGVGLCADVWQPQIDAFSPGYRVVVPDLPGHGDSSSLSRPWPSVTDYSIKITEFLEEVVQEPAVIIGHSLGALISLDLAARHLSLCQGMAALAPIYRRSPAAKQAVQRRARDLSLNKPDCSAEAPIERWFGIAPKGQNLELARACRHWLNQVDHQGYAQAYSAFAQYDGPDERTLNSLQMPCLFLSAEHDQNSTPQMSESLAAQVASSKAVMVSNARHMVPLSHADEVNTALMQLLALCESISTSNQTSSAGAMQ